MQGQDQTLLLWRTAARRAGAAVSALALLPGAERPALPVTGAELGRNAPERHGRFEASVMFAPGDGIVSSMFLWKPGSELEGAYWNEIDIEKIGADCAGYSSNAIYGDPEMQSTERASSSADLCTGYHTHTIEWTPDSLIWRLDGSEVRRLDPSQLAAFEQNAPAGMQIRFNLWVGDPSFGGNFHSSSLPAHQFIDWVAYSRYTPGAGAGGGDFTPLWREDFDAPLGSEWFSGTWASPLGNSVHSPANINVSGGVGVLSLTDDAATGFAGTAPPGEASGGAGAGGMASAGASDAGRSGGAGAGGTGVASAVDPTGSERERSDSGCQLERVGEPLSRWFLPSTLLALLGALSRRRRRRWLH